MPTSPYTDLDRPPLHQAALRWALMTPGALWTDVRVVAETGSTNADVAAAAREGAPEGLVLVAECQRAGRGRLGRQWTSPARAGIAVSVLLRPGASTPAYDAVPPHRYGWLPLLTGVALAEAVRRVAAVEATLKWPNDLLAGQGDEAAKCAGVLAEAVPQPDAGPAVVVGVGLNTTMRTSELPHPGTTSLALAGAVCSDRDPLLRSLLRALEAWYRRWRATGGDAAACGLAEAYTTVSDTIGRQVSVARPDGGTLQGHAGGLDGDGRLLVTARDGSVHAVAAGDVVHLRAAR